MDVSDQRISLGALRLDASTVCQLKCPSCPHVGGKIYKHIGAGFLKAEDFRHLLENNRGRIHSIELSNYGEPFLNPDMLEIMQIASVHGVGLMCKNGANLNNVREDVLEGIVKYGMRAISCSIDGATDATYAMYRRKGNFSMVIRNILKINEYKTKFRSVFPRLSWQYVIFGHNEHEIADARALAQKLGMEFIPKLSWDSDFSPVRNPEKVMQDSGLKAATRDDYQKANNKLYLNDICEQLWDMPQINYDGRVLGCCVNYWDAFGGNAFDDLDGALNSERMRYARGMLMGKVPARDDIPCTICGTYKKMRDMEQWVVPDRPKLRLKRFAKKVLAKTDSVRYRLEARLR